MSIFHKVTVRTICFFKIIFSVCTHRQAVHRESGPRSTGPGPWARPCFWEARESHKALYLFSSLSSSAPIFFHWSRRAEQWRHGRSSSVWSRPYGNTKWLNSKSPRSAHDLRDYQDVLWWGPGTNSEVLTGNSLFHGSNGFAYILAQDSRWVSR